MSKNLPHYEEEEDAGDGKARKDFDCPDCSANNPYDEGIRAGDEVRCYYCGAEFKVEISSEGKLKFREA